MAKAPRHDASSAVPDLLRRPRSQGLRDSWLAFGTPVLAFSLVVGAVDAGVRARPEQAIGWGVLVLALMVSARTSRLGVRRVAWLTVAAIGFGLAVLTTSTPVSMTVQFLAAPWLVVGSILLVEPRAFRAAGGGVAGLAVTTLVARQAVAPWPTIDGPLELGASALALALTLGGLHALGTMAFRAVADNRAKHGRLQRAMSMLEEKLAASNARALAAHEATDRLLAAVSHELRTPLNAVRGYTEIVLEDLEDTDLVDIQHDLGRIHLAASQLLERIGSMLELTPTNPMARDLEIEPVDIMGVVTDAVGIVQRRLDGNGNRLKLDGPSDPPRFSTDLPRLRHLFAELLTTAATLVHQEVVTVQWHVEAGVLDLAVVHGSARLAMDVPEAALESSRRTAETLEGRLELEATARGAPIVRVRLPDLDRPVAIAG